MTDEERQMFSRRLREAAAEIERLCGDKIAWQNVAAEYQAEIERLTADNKQLRDLNELLPDEAQKAEIERLRAELRAVLLHVADVRAQMNGNQNEPDQTAR